MRVIIYTGKGGVGKTSIAAATALRTAKLGYRTIIMSTDSAHSLGDSLEVPLSGEIQNIRPNLDAIEIDVLNEMETRWKEIEEYLSSFMRAQGLEGISAKEMAILPGMELMSALFYLWDFDCNESYDVVIMDTAPTAETLRLLSFPDVSKWYIDRLSKLLKRMLKLARFAMGRLSDIPLPDADFVDSMELIGERMMSVREILQDMHRTSIRLVINPEKMVINETKRTYTYMSLYGLNVEALMINRILPLDEASVSYFQEKVPEQEGYMRTITESFYPLKFYYSNQMPTEMLGMEKLDHLADMLFEGEDPTINNCKERPMQFSTDGDMDILSLRLPFSQKSDLQLFRKSNDILIVQVGSHKRNITLPLTLTHSKVFSADLEGDRLLIRFKRAENDGI
ncbi:MAG: ArsA family ATPase [Candidatus Methanomethylophilaceae archaeon]